MSKIAIVFSIQDFYIYFNDLLEKYGASIFVENRIMNNPCESFILNKQNISKVVDSYNTSSNVHFYITTSILPQNNCVNNFYSEEINTESIEGTGGRESVSEVELMTLRLISKDSSKEIKKIFTSIKAKLKKDHFFKQGLKSGESLYKNDIYPLSYLNSKIMVIDMDRKELFNPLIPIEKDE